MLRVPAAAFDPAALAPGRKHALALDLGPGAPGLDLPVLVARGAAAGPSLAITAGVHGDEYEGVRAVFEVFDALEPAALRGTVVAVPVANPPAFWNASRTSPLDGGNLARAFPGRADGTPTQVIAFHLAHAVIARADFLLDLHTAGAKLLMPGLVGYDATNARSGAAARIFGAPVVWRHSLVAPGRTISFAASRGIPWLYTEGKGAGRVDAEDFAMFKRGLFNLLRHLGIQPGAPGDSGLAPAPTQLTLLGDGDLDASVTATRAGFFVPAVTLLQAVGRGQELGQTLDLHGAVVERFVAPRPGVVAMLRAAPVVAAGDAVFLLADVAKEI